MREWWVLSALALAGCDVVWRIDGVHSSVDAPTFSACGVGHDEDGDAVLDGCDLCPGIADDQADGDEDGVGDACDPSATEQNELALFVTFADGTTPWRVLSGNWVQKQDSLVFDSVTLQTHGLALHDGNLPEPPFVLEAHLAIDSIPQLTSSLSIIADADDAGDGVRCGIVRRESPIRDLVRVEHTQVIADEIQIMPIGPGGHRVTLTYDRMGDPRCAFAADDKSTSGTSTIALPAPPSTGGLGLRSLHVGTTVHWIAIYKTR